MKFGPTPVQGAADAILAHSLRVGEQRFKKGRVLSHADVEQLQQAGLETVIAARLEPDDVGEDEAANVLAGAIGGDGVDGSAAFTGRCNLFAARSGLLVIDRPQLDRVNRVHEDLTVATLPPFSVVDTGQMVATIKIIPFAVHRAQLDACLTVAQEGSILRVVEFQRKRAGLIQTRLPGVKESVLDKTVRVLQSRLEALGGDMIGERRCDHVEAEVAGAIRQLLGQGADMVLIAGASAIVDRRDVVPAAIENIGGVVEHFGMPVDPGNLLLLGYRDSVPIIGLPGCARSPKYNGFDQVLVRLAAKLPVTREDIMALGAGGLLKEISSRPMPRSEAAPKAERAPARAPRVAALILAAGQSRRMGRINKLLAAIDGVPMVARVADAVSASQASPIVVVTGHELQRVEQTLAEYNVTFVHNPEYAEGLSTSLRHGLAALPNDIDGVLVCLGDMPRVSVTHINRLIAAFDPVEGRAICVPTCRGKRGNPVLWSKRFFEEMREVAGDVGAKHLLGDYAELVCEVEMEDEGILVDVDSPQSLAAITRR